MPICVLVPCDVDQALYHVVEPVESWAGRSGIWHNV